MTITNTTIEGLVGPDAERKLEIKVNAIRDETNELVQSGLTATTKEVTELAGGGPRIVRLDYVKPLSTSEYNVSNDDINDEGSVGKQEAGSYNAHRLDLNYAWGTTAMTQIITRYGSTGDLATGVAGFQNAVSKGLLGSTLKGVRAAVEANTTITKDVATAWDKQAIYDVVANAEEFHKDFTGLMVSYGRFAKLRSEQSGFVPASETKTMFANWNGFNLMLTDTLTDDQAIAFRIGALGYGEGNVQQAFEVERKANAGNGGGADILHARFSRVLAPQGLDYKGDIAKTQAEVVAFLEDADNWSLFVPAKQFGFRFVNFNVD